MIGLPVRGSDAGQVSCSKCPQSAYNNRSGYTDAEETKLFRMFSIKNLLNREWKYCPDEECFVYVLRSDFGPEYDLVIRSTLPATVPPDGWIRTVDDELLLWVPPG